MQYENSSRGLHTWQTTDVEPQVSQIPDRIGFYIQTEQWRLACDPLCRQVFFSDIFSHLILISGMLNDQQLMTRVRDTDLAEDLKIYTASREHPYHTNEKIYLNLL